MDTEIFYDLLEACNGCWRDPKGNMLMFIRPYKRLAGKAIFQSLQGPSYDLEYEVKLNEDRSIVQIGNRLFNLSVLGDDSIQLERNGKVTFYTLV